MKTVAHDLLADSLLSWRNTGRHRGKTTLPGLLARLSNGELEDFPRLRTHQFHPWCMFLTQLAAIALHLAGNDDPRMDEAEWASLLLALTDGRHEPWSLVVDDLAAPAFFQPPVPEMSLDGWSRRAAPDDIDILVTAKAHDVKSGVIPADDIEAWCYALVTLQTMQGVYGQKQYGIARMNKGLGNRPRIGCTSDHTASRRFIRDTQVLLETWSDLLDRGFDEDGTALVWTKPWDGDRTLTREELAPHFIEVCRRVRCRVVGSAIACFSKPTSARRSFATGTEERGDVGDPWIPIARATGAALTVSKAGFTYQLVAELLCSENYTPAAAQRHVGGDGDPILYSAWALVRGQGKTDGMHGRDLPIPAPVRWKLGKPDDRALIGVRARVQVDQAKRMRNKVLFPALKELGADDTSGFSRRIDEMFFDYLFTNLDLEEVSATQAFNKRIRDIAWNELQRTFDACGFEDARRLKLICAAERRFLFAIRKHFSDLTSTTTTGDQEGAA